MEFIKREFVMSGDSPAAIKKRFVKYEQAVSDWLGERLADYDGAVKSGDAGYFEKWMFDEATDAQIRRLDALGFEVREANKGPASDLIGLFQPVDPDDVEILKFFKVKAGGMSLSEGRHRVAVLMFDPKRVAEYENRSIGPIEKAHLGFLKIKFERGVGYKDYLGLIESYQDRVYRLLDSKDEKHKRAGKLGESRIDEWDDYLCCYEDLVDSDFRADFGIKKISLSLYDQAVQALKESGVSGLYDPEKVLKKVKKLKPDISR